MTLAALLTSCSSYEESASPYSASDEISFASEITSRAMSEWSEGDEILVTASNSQSATYSYDGALFTSDTPLTFTSTGSMSFNAVYPASAATATSLYSGSFSFTAPANQSSLASYEAADLLVATASSDSRTPSLTFNHAMAHITIEVEGASSLTLNMCNSASCSVSGSAQYSGSAVDITPYLDGDGSFSAVVAPQSLAINECVATVIVGGRVVEWIPESVVTLESGKSYTFEWDIEAQEVTLVSTTGVEGWSDNEPFLSIVSELIAQSAKDSEWSTYYDSDGSPLLGGDALSLTDATYETYYALENIWDGVYSGTTTTAASNYFHSAYANSSVRGIGYCITIDLGREYILTDIFLSHRRYTTAHTYGGHMIKTFDVYGVSDGGISSVSLEADNVPDFTAWTPLLLGGLWAPEGYVEGDTITTAQISELNTAQGAWFGMTESGLIPVRYLRIHAKTNWGNTNGFTLAEIDVKGVEVEQFFNIKLRTDYEKAIYIYAPLRACTLYTLVQQRRWSI